VLHQGLQLSGHLGVAQLQKQPIAVQGEPDTADEVAKDDLDDLTLPSDVCLVGYSRTDQKADAAPKLPCIHPEGQTLPFSAGEWKVPCRQSPSYQVWHWCHLSHIDGSCPKVWTPPQSGIRLQRLSVRATCTVV